jgi:hypothetical protein
MSARFLQRFRDSFRNRAGASMSLSSRCLRRSVFSLLWMVSGACAAQQVDRPLAASIATTVTLALCVGGSTPNCPTTGVPTGISVVSPMSMVYGQVFNGTESVSDADGSAFSGTGSLDFYQDGSLLCTLTASGPATCPANVGMGTTAGTHMFVSVYSGDATHGGATSNTVTINVAPDTTTAMLTPSPNPSPSGAPVTLTATVTGEYAAPTGGVVFTEFFPPTALVAQIGTATLTPGPGITSTATLTTTTLPVGVDPIEVGYAATQNFDAAESAVVDEVITQGVQGAFTISVTPNPVSVGVGLGAQVTVTVTPVNGFAQAVKLSCANLPTEAGCSFGTATIAGGGGSTAMTVTTAAPHNCGSSQPYFYGRGRGGPGMAPFALPALAGLMGMFAPGRRRWLRGLVAMAAIAVAMQMGGCGNCTDLGTRPATYTIQVMGTAAGGTPEVESQAMTLNVML